MKFSICLLVLAVVISMAQGAPASASSNSVSRPDICNLPKPDLEGSCRKSKFGYYFNENMQDCKTFFLIGCTDKPGTSPGFENKEECMKTCMHK